MIIYTDSYIWCRGFRQILENEFTFQMCNLSSHTKSTFRKIPKVDPGGVLYTSVSRQTKMDGISKRISSTNTRREGRRPLYPRPGDRKHEWWRIVYTQGRGSCYGPKTNISYYRLLIYLLAVSSVFPFKFKTQKFTLTFTVHLSCTGINVLFK